MKTLFTLTGVAVPGKRLGTQLGFPTANLRYEPREGFPADGVYVASATARGQSYVAILNQGRHPTAPEGPPTVEAHLLDYAGEPLYGEQITLVYLRYLRPEARFESLAALRAQLARDLSAARAWAREHLDTAKENA